jgi:hypothetical protein
VAVSELQVATTIVVSILAISSTQHKGRSSTARIVIGLYRHGHGHGKNPDRKKMIFGDSDR